MRTLLIVIGLTLAVLTVLPTSSAAPTCTGVYTTGDLTGYCTNDPNCPSPSGSGTGYYVLGKWQACTLN